MSNITNLNEFRRKKQAKKNPAPRRKLAIPTGCGQHTITQQQALLQRTELQALLQFGDDNAFKQFRPDLTPDLTRMFVQQELDYANNVINCEWCKVFKESRNQ